MITKEDFLREFPGASSSYSNYFVIGKTVDEIVDCLNKLNINNDVFITDQDGSPQGIGFVIFDEEPDLIYKITAELHCIGFADIDWDMRYFAAAKDGLRYDDFYAEWAEGFPCERGDDGYDAFAIITDKATGAIFYTGAGAVDLEDVDYYKQIVENHIRR